MTRALPLPELPPPSWVDDRALYQRLAESIEPVAVVTTKDSATWTALWALGVVATLGVFAFALSLRRFLEEFATTFITRQGYPRVWGALSRGVVAHEARHSTQATWFGWLLFPVAWVNRRLRAWLGLPGFALVYFVLPLPMGLAWGRFRLELDADEAAWRRGLREGWLGPEDVRTWAEDRAEVVSGAAYAWAWPRPWARGSYRRMVARIVREAAAGEL